MLKSHLIAAALVICTVGGAASTYAQAPTSPTPVIDKTTTAQSAGSGPSCTGAVTRAKDNIFLRIQQNTGTESRAAAQLHLSLAERAAAFGDEAGCWRELDVSRQYVR